MNLTDPCAPDRARAAPPIAAAGASASVARSLPVMLLRAREAVLDHFRPVLKAHDLTEQQWRVLRVISQRRSVDATALASGASILAPSLTRMLRLLEQRGLIEIVKDRADMRRSLIALSAEGQTFLDRVSSDCMQITDRIENALGQDRIGRLIDELHTVLDRLYAQD